jgi:hypothetical protein
LSQVPNIVDPSRFPHIRPELLVIESNERRIWLRVYVSLATRSALPP